MILDIVTRSNLFLTAKVNFLLKSDFWGNLLIAFWRNLFNNVLGVMVRRVAEARHRRPPQWYFTHFERNCGDAFSKRIFEGEIAWQQYNFGR